MMSSDAEDVRVSDNDVDINEQCPLSTDRLSGLSGALLATLPHQLQLRPGSQSQQLSIWSRSELKGGTRFGPFTGKTSKQPIPASFNWKVTDVTGTFNAWLEIIDFNALRWITYLKKADLITDRNTVLLLFRGQLYIELIRDVEIGKELSLVFNEVLLIAEDDVTKNIDKPEGSLLAFLLRNAANIPSTAPYFNAILAPLSEHRHFSALTDTFRKAALNSPTDSPLPKGPHSPSSFGLFSKHRLSIPSLNETNEHTKHFEDKHPSSSEAASKCSFCEQTYPDPLGLSEHLSAVHSDQSEGGDREFKCSQCPKEFLWKSNLTRHQVAHDDSRRYTCETCKKVFTDPSNLQRHIRSQHIGARSHACPECGKTFATSSGLKQHTHIHSSVKPFRCEVCLKAYTQFSNLCRHKRMHANCRQNIKCKKCGQPFTTAASLSKHKKFCEGNNSIGRLPRNEVVVSTSSDVPTLDSQTEASIRSKTAPCISPIAGQNPFLLYPRTGFPFYPSPLFGFPNIFPNVQINSCVSENSLGANSLTSPNSSNSLPVNLFCKTSTPDDKREQTSPPALNKHRDTKFFEKDSNSQIVTQKKEKEEKHCESEGDSTDFSESEAESNTSEAEVRSESGESSSDKNSLFDEEPQKLKSESMASNRTTSPKQGSVCPEAVIGSNGYLKYPQLTSHRNEAPFDLSRSNKSARVSILSMEESPEFKSKVNENIEEPLDLRVSRKRSHNQHPTHAHHQHQHHHHNHHENTHSHSLSLANSEFNVGKQLSLFSENKSHSDIRHENINAALVNSKAGDHFQRPFSPSKLPMYPRPIHPLLLESISMYRMQMDAANKPQPAAPFSMFGEHQRFLPAFPPRYPPSLLNPAMIGNPTAAAAAAATFDLMRAHMQDKIGKSAAVQEMMSPQLIKSKERYTCKFCGKVFPRSANLTRHLRTHTGEQPYKCKYCERSFSISSNLQRHVRNIHNKEKPFKCPLCDRCFGQQTNLDRHLKKHESDGPTILDDSPKISHDNDEKDNGDAYFNEIRSFMGKVTADHRALESAKLMAPPGYIPDKKNLNSPFNGTNDDETGQDEESSDLEDGVTPTKKSRLNSDSSSNVEDDAASVTSFADSVSVASDNETVAPSNSYPRHNSKNGTFNGELNLSRYTRPDISSVVACLSKKAEQKQKLNGHEERRNEVNNSPKTVKAKNCSNGNGEQQ